MATKAGCCGSDDLGARSAEPAVAEVCSLPEAELGERLAMIRADFGPQVRGRARLPDGRAWSFDVAMRPKLEQLVALERACCSGLTWSVREEGDRVWLEVRGSGADALPDLGAAVAADSDDLRR